MVPSPEPRPYPFSEPQRLRLDPEYAKLRAAQKLVRVQLPFGEETWLATRYADVRAVLSDPRFGRAEGANRDEPRTTPVAAAGGIMMMDPPDHTRIRTLVSRAFTARRVKDLRPRIQEITDNLIRDMHNAGQPVDLVESFAFPLPVRVICEMLGVPAEDWGLFREWSKGFFSTTSLSFDQVTENVANMYAYVGELVSQRKDAPTEDLIGALVQARDEQDRLSDPEVADMAVGLLVGGHETTGNQIANAVYVFLTNPDQLGDLRSAPELMVNAVDEIMRYVPIGASAAFPRYAKEDVDIGGVTVRAGESVIVSLSSANRDEAAFSHAGQLDIHRSRNAHVGFGHGVHHCVGAPLARLELEVALGTLLETFPDLHLAVPDDEVPWRSGTIVMGPAELLVGW